MSCKSIQTSATEFAYSSSSGNRLASCLEVLPEESSPTLHLASTEPVSLKQIEVNTLFTTNQTIMKSFRSREHDTSCINKQKTLTWIWFDSLRKQDDYTTPERSYMARHSCSRCDLYLY